MEPKYKHTGLVSPQVRDVLAWFCAVHIAVDRISWINLDWVIHIEDTNISTIDKKIKGYDLLCMSI